MEQTKNPYIQKIKTTGISNAFNLKKNNSSGLEPTRENLYLDYSNVSCCRRKKISL